MHKQTLTLQGTHRPDDILDELREGPLCGEGANLRMRSEDIIWRSWRCRMYSVGSNLCRGDGADLALYSDPAASACKTRNAATLLFVCITVDSVPVTSAVSQTSCGHCQTKCCQSGTASRDWRCAEPV